MGAESTLAHRGTVPLQPPLAFPAAACRRPRGVPRCRNAAPIVAAAAPVAPEAPTSTVDAGAFSIDPFRPAPPHPSNIYPDLDARLLPYDPAGNPRFDLAVAGAGPSGLAVAERVAAAGFSVVVIDPNPLAPWINNFGVWCDEFEAMGLDDCFDVVWSEAVVHLDSGRRGARRLERPYARVDRPKLKRKLME
jgi:xanthine/CO dehydrogenase XdhC/CoxF family maturation factor